MTRATRSAMLAALVALIAISPGAPAAVGSSSPGPPRSVIVTLRAKADLAGISGTRAQRLARHIRRLQAKADATQRPFEASIDGWRRQGRVTTFTRFWIFNGFAITATPDVIDALARNPAVASVTSDLTITAPPAAAASGLAEPNISLVNAPAVWSLGDTGQGVVIGSLDTGVDAGHPDLASRWRGGGNSWYDPYGQHPTTPIDLSGHGTQVMGVMVGGSAGGSSIGVAPGAQWIAARIFNDQGQGSASNIHLAFQWLLDPDHDPSTPDAPQVVNSSWTYASGCSLEFAPDIQALRSAGILPVFAAGNSAGINTSPANNPGALAVGSTTILDTIASDSSQGPSACGQPSNTFPELTAPGVDIRTSDLFDGYTTQSGTSLAAPHVAGALALLLSAHPSLGVSQQEAALEQGAKDLGPAGPDNTYGYGRLDVLAAYNTLTAPDFSLSATPSAAATTAGGSVSYTVTVTAPNGFAGDVALSLTGLSPSQGSSGFTPATVTGSGTSQLTITTDATLAPGTYPLTITGASGSLSRTATVALVVPAPDFDINVSPSSAATPAGTSASFAVSLAARNGFAGDVALSLTGGLTTANATWTFTPSTVAGGSGTSRLAVTPATTLTPGSYTLVITGASGPISHTALVTLVVSPPPGFSLDATPASASTIAGGTASFTVTVAPSAGFSTSVSLATSGLPAGTTGTFLPQQLTGGSGTSRLTIATTTSVAAGTYPLAISGTGGSQSASTGVTLVVTAAPFPTSVTIQSGSLRSGTVSDLSADDTRYYTVASTTSGTRTSAWYGTITGVPNTAATLNVTYKGKSSRTCAQTVAVWNWSSGAWVQLDARSVGPADVLIGGLAVPGPLANHVSGTSGPGNVRVRIKCTASTSFTSSGTLLKVVFTGATPATTSARTRLHRRHATGTARRHRLIRPPATRTVATGVH